MLNVYGRLALLSPTENLQKILQRAGIQNFLKIYNSEDELQRASEEIIQQTTSLRTADVKAFTAPEEKPVSEFEDFRSEIGKAIETGEPGQTPESEEIFTADNTFSVPPHALPPETVSAQSEPMVFDEPIQPPLQYGEIASDFPNLTPQFQDFEPQPIPPSLQPEYDEFQKTSAPTFQEAPPAPPQFEAPPEAPPRFGPSSDAQPTEQVTPPVEEVFQVDTTRERDRYVEEDFEEFAKKKAPVGPIIIVLILILVIGGGAYYLFFSQGKQKATSVAKVEKPVAEQIPQIDVEKQTPVEKEAEEEKTPEKPEIKVTKPKPRKPTPIKKAPSTPIKTKPRPKPTIPDKLTITSYPSNATVIIDGKEKGNTPYTWNKPNVYGQVAISVDKNGYVSKKMNVNYTGGTVKKHFVLTRAPITPKPTSSSTRTTASTTKTTSQPTPTQPVVRPKPKPTPKPRPTPSSGGAAGTVFISSLPPMADVFMDGRPIGKTNIDKLKISAGTHTMKFVKGDKQLTKQMTFKAGENPSQLIRLK